MKQDPAPSKARTATITYTIEFGTNRSSSKSNGEPDARPPASDPGRATPPIDINAPLIAVVTADDIESARLDRTRGCPIAVALSRVFGQTALVGYETIWHEDGSRILAARATVGRQSWMLPSHAVEFMRSVDQDCGVLPITIELPEVRS
jgi:hypothetical protein